MDVVSAVHRAAAAATELPAPSEASGSSLVFYVKIFSTAIALLLVWDQISYKLKKGLIAGLDWKWLPVVGPFMESLDPKFEEYKAKWDLGPLSCVLVFHKFVVIASTRDLARKVLSAHQYVKPCVVDVAIKILRPTNWVFLDGKVHGDYRKGLNPLFTKEALLHYFPAQEELVDKYLQHFLTIGETEGAQEFFPHFRELLCAISLRTFCGTYITDEQVKMVADNYYRVTAALELVNFPIIIPYTKTWYGKKIADDTMKIFETCAGKAKEYIKAGGKPKCVMDEWVLKMQQDAARAEAGPLSSTESKNLLRDFTNREILETIFTFLFALQDALSLLACWLFQIVADRPDIANKIRKEQLAVRNNNLDTPVTLDLIELMKYTNACVKELLRYRPPVLMVPYVVKKLFPVTSDYTVPKGAMVVPTLYPALHDPDVYTNPDEYDPERFMADPTGLPHNPAEARKNWLVFGTGPHVCLGQTYVMMLFTFMLGKFLLEADLDHTVTDLSEEIKVFATIFPKDDLILRFRRRDPTHVD